MNTAALEFDMPDVTQGTGLWGSVAAGIAAILAILYTLWSKMGVSKASDNAEVDALKLLTSAVDHWKSLYDVAWEQVVKEREMRLAAESRASMAVQEVEGLRSEVASLRREIERLTALITSKGLA